MAEPTFEEARAELERIVAELESGRADLEGALALWERGEELTGSASRGSTPPRARSRSSRPGEALAEHAPPDGGGDAAPTA